MLWYLIWISFWCWFFILCYSTPTFHSNKMLKYYYFHFANFYQKWHISRRNFYLSNLKMEEIMCLQGENAKGIKGLLRSIRMDTIRFFQEIEFRKQRLGPSQGHRFWCDMSKWVGIYFWQEKKMVKGYTKWTNHPFWLCRSLEAPWSCLWSCSHQLWLFEKFFAWVVGRAKGHEMN